MTKLVIGQPPHEHVTFEAVERADGPESDEPAARFAVSGSATDVRFRSFHAVFAVTDLVNFLGHLRQIAKDNTQGGYLESLDGKVKLKLRGEGTGTCEADLELSDAPDRRQPHSRTHVIYRHQLEELMRTLESFLDDQSEPNRSRT